jgi:nucleoside-diphosphate-sugar epimerase
MTYVVSGATGWMGRSALEVLEKTVARNEDLVGFARHPGYLMLTSGRQIELMSYQDSKKVQSVQGFIHTAFPTQNLIYELGVADYQMSCKSITGWLKNFIDSTSPKWSVGISSGVLSESIFPNPRSIGDLGLYAKWKQLEESLLMDSTCKNVAIGRLFSASGRFMTKPKKLALGDFILRGMNGDSIVVESNVLGVRNYIDAEDFIETLIFAVQMYPRIILDSNGIEITIPELAKAVSGFFPNSRVICDFDKFSDKDLYLPQKTLPYQELSTAAGVGVREIEDQISRTILGLRADINRN